MMRKIFRAAVAATAAAAMLLLGMVAYWDAQLPDDYYVSDAASFSLPQYPMLQPDGGGEAVPASRRETAISRQAELKLGGTVPVKTIRIYQTEKRYLVPCGTPFGLKLTTEGVLVVGISPVETASGVVCPAQTAGLQKGDLLLAADGWALSSFQDLAQAVAGSEGRALRLTVRREGRELEVAVTPVRSLSGVFQCGIWGRDSSAGIGTVTFYDPSTGQFGGLGHGVCDADTGSLMPLAEGEVVPAVILDVIPGTAGTPGELRGSFSGAFSCGVLEKNTPCGVFGLLYTAPSRAEPMEICPRQEVVTGPAEILTTVSGSGPERYEIEIERIDYLENRSRNLVIRVMDSDLLEETGGIVQGMSGSPIIQDGKLVGAVTHVLVNDPTRGYGIFIENMLDAAG